MDPRSVNLLIPHESMITYHSGFIVNLAPIWIRDVWVVVEHRTVSWIIAVVTMVSTQGVRDDPCLRQRCPCTVPPLPAARGQPLKGLLHGTSPIARQPAGLSV